MYANDYMLEREATLLGSMLYKKDYSILTGCIITTCEINLNTKTI